MIAFGSDDPGKVETLTTINLSTLTLRTKPIPFALLKQCSFRPFVRRNSSPDTGTNYMQLHTSVVAPAEFCALQAYQRLAGQIAMTIIDHGLTSGVNKRGKRA